VADPEEQAPTDPVEWLTDVLYTGVGLGILAINRIQVARRDLEKSHGGSDVVNPGVAAIQDLLADPERTKRVVSRLQEELQDLDDRFDGFETRLTGILDDIEPELPGAARELAVALRNLAGDHAAQVRAVLGLRAREGHC